MGIGKQNGYISAELTYANWKKSPANPELFTRLENVIKEYPELSQKYNGLIAQVLINAGQPKKAHPFAIKTLERVKNDASHFSDYGNTTLVINQRDWSQALLDAQRLKENILADPDYSIRKGAVASLGSFLYAWNLIRIAFLQMEHQNDLGELEAWKDLEDFLGWNERISEHSRVSEMILKNFQKKGITLPDYIAYRKGILLTKSN